MDTQGLSCYCDEPPMTRGQFLRSRARTLIEIPDDGPNYMKAMIPLRILIFVMTFALLALLVYLSSLNKPELRDASAILLVGVTSAFLFFSVIHIIGHFGATDTVEFPMIFGSFVAIVCFTFIGALIAYSAPTRSWARLMSFVVCFIIGFLHAVDVLLAIGYWRHKYSNRRKCGPKMPTQIDFDHNTYNTSINPPMDVCKCDVQTSMTGTGIVLDSHDDNPFRSYSTKKSTEPQIIDCPRVGFSMLSARGIQTNLSPIQREVQTTKIQVKEMPVQTASKCDLCHRHIDMNLMSHRQYGAQMRDLSPTKYTTVATSPYKSSTPLQITPTHPTSSSSSPTRQNLKCLCIKPMNYSAATPLSTVGPTGAPCCGSCDCSSLTSGKKVAVLEQQQPQSQQISNRSVLPRVVDTASEIDPNYDMSTICTNLATADMAPRRTKKSIRSHLNVDPGDNKRSKESQRVYDTRPTSTRSKPFIGRLAAISGCLTKNSAPSMLVHKNKRTQTKGQNDNKYNSTEEDENLQNYENENRELMNETKSMTKEVEVRSVNLNTSHKVLPKIQSTSKKEDVNVRVHELYASPPRNLIEVKEKVQVKNDMTPKPIDIDMKVEKSGESSSDAVDANVELNSTPRTRTKKLYREPVLKPVKIENEEILSKSEGNSGGTDHKLSDKTVSNRLPQIKTESNTHTTFTSIETSESMRLKENVLNNNKSEEPKEEIKIAALDETTVGTSKRSRNRSNSGSSLYRPAYPLKNGSETTPPKKNWTSRPNKDIPAEKSPVESKVIKTEASKPLGSLKKEPPTNKDYGERSVNNDDVGTAGITIRKVICSVCRKTKRPFCHCSSNKDGKNEIRNEKKE